MARLGSQCPRDQLAELCHVSDQHPTPSLPHPHWLLQLVLTSSHTTIHTHTLHTSSVSSTLALALASEVDLSLSLGLWQDMLVSASHNSRAAIAQKSLRHQEGSGQGLHCPYKSSAAPTAGPLSTYQCMWGSAFCHST